MRTMRKKKTDNERIYFSTKTEAAIIAYNLSNDLDEREVIYVSKIGKALDKLAENVINRFDFPYINVSFDDLKRQVVSYLVTNLHKYTQDKGKAFSYFSVVAKNYLILHNNNGYKEEKRSVSISDANDAFVSIEEVISLEAPNEREHEDTQEFVRLMIDYWDRNLTLIFRKKRDIDIANAVVELFRRADGIENFNKKALYVMIREMTDCKTSYITKVINKMRLHTARQLEEYYRNGTIEKDYNRDLDYEDEDDDE
jgi:hypothetical protein